MLRKPTLVTTLALKYLLSIGRAHMDAFDGLMACCWRAKGNLYIKPDGCADSSHVTYTSVAAWERYSAADRVNSPFNTYNGLRWGATRDFISDRLQEILLRYEDLIVSDIQEQAEDGKLKWIAREVRNRMVDHVRAQYKADESPGEPHPPAKTDTKQSAELVLTDLDNQKARLVRLIGTRMFETLRAVVRHYPFGDTRRQRKGNLTRAIAREREVSEQQARADKRELMENAAQLDHLVCRTVERFIDSPELSFRASISE